MDLYQTLCDEHGRLEALYEALLNCVHVNDSDAAQVAWTELDHALTAHFEAEETVMLPLLDRFDPAEAAAIRREHGTMRELLAAIGVLLDIHALREDKVTQLIRFLRAHAAREEAKLYPWAVRELPEAPQQSLLERLRHRHPRPRSRHLEPRKSATAR